MTTRKNQVRKFYQVIWNQYDISAVPSVLHKDFTFRGSLGDEKHGHMGFIEYMDKVHNALGDYQCTIEELVAEGDKVFAKMLFTGIHQKEFLGYRPTLRHVNWHGCALFSFDRELVTDLWVLGDLKNLEAQLVVSQDEKFGY